MQTEIEQATLEASAEALESKSLRRCIADLTSLVALPAIWSGAEPVQIAGTLMDALVDMLQLDLVYVSLRPGGLSDDRQAVEIVRGAIEKEMNASPVNPQETGTLLRRVLGDDHGEWPARASYRLADAALSLVTMRLGTQGEFGVLVAASGRREFAEPTELLLLSVAVNQAVIALQSARLLGASRSVIDGIPGLVATLAPDGGVEAVNRQIIEYTGQPLEALQHWGTNGTVHPDDMQHVARIFVRSITDGVSYQIEQRLRRFDGAYRWFNNRGTPARDASGSIVRWYVLLTDIDDRKRAESAVAANERNLQLTIDTIPALAWSARPDGSAEFLNQHYQEYVGLSADQLQGTGWTAAIHPDDRRGLIDAWEAMMASGRGSETEARLRRFDGEYRWLLFRTNPLRNEAGEIIKWYGINIDIQDLKRTQEELKRSEAFLVEGQRLSSMGSFSWRMGSGIELDLDEITFSDELYRIFEFDREALLTLEQIGKRVHPEDLALLTRKIEMARTGVADHDYDIRLRMADGTIKHLRTVARANPQPNGRVELLGTIQDITERRLSEDALENVRSELAHVTRTMSLGVLTASIAHEVNQPLAGIITNANTCVRMLAADPPNLNVALETARRTIRDGNRAAEVISRLRALFRKHDFASEAVDLNEATREVIALSWQSLQQRRITLQAELDESLPQVSGDRVQLQQVILNLLSNASDSMKAIDDRPRQISIRTARDEAGAARLSVQDTGAGLVPESRTKLFEAFYTTKTDGMGIGLSVSRSIIESHHGRLWCEPNEGPGATFAFSIPIATFTPSLA